MKYFPIALNLDKKNVLVVGAGEVAWRKIKKLLHTQAKIKVVSPYANRGVKDLSEKGLISWEKDTLEYRHLKEADLIIASTNDREVNRCLSGWAKEEKILINVVDNSNLSDFISPAILFPEEGIIAVYTDGKDPALSRDLKSYLKENWDDFLSYRSRL